DYLVVYYSSYDANSILEIIDVRAKPRVIAKKSFRPTFADGVRLQDVNHDGWPEITLNDHGNRYGYFSLWRWTGKTFEPMAAHKLGAQRTMTIENYDYDDSPAPDATVELNGRVIARPRDFASKPRILRFPVTLDAYNVVCASGRDPVRLTITIEPAHSLIKP